MLLRSIVILAPYLEHVAVAPPSEEVYMLPSNVFSLHKMHTFICPGLDSLFEGDGLRVAVGEAEFPKLEKIHVIFYKRDAIRC
jgi:hypothetical protein